jgi:hypothetical protein
VAAVAIVGFLAVNVSGEREDARAVPRAAAAAPEERAVAAPEAVMPEDPGPRGRTAFVRRLEIGSDLRTLLDSVEQRGIWAAQFPRELDRIRPFLLVADGEGAKDERPIHTLSRLTAPPRDLAGLILAGGTRGDPIGSTMCVRVWTREEAYPEAERARISATIEHITRSVGREVEGGIDVLVTDRMGADVFPLQTTNSYAAGMYFSKDRYCVARANLSGEFRPEVIEHECIHAIHLALPSATRSRFIGEGLAEYLRMVEPGDDGLKVPQGRLKDSFAELQFILRRLKEVGVGIEKIDPSRLVDLSAKEFYALRHLGYLVAQLTMAYLGGDAIERALAEGSDAPLVKMARGIAWADFLRFVNEGAVGGELGRVRVVQDIPASRQWSSRESFVDALKALGAGLPDVTVSVDPMIAGARSVGALESDIGNFLEILQDTPWTPRIYVDLSPAMDRPVRLAPGPEAVTNVLKGDPRGDTPRQFAKELVAFLAKGRSVEVVGLCKERHVGGGEVLDTVREFEGADLYAGATPAVVVVIVAGRNTASAVTSLTDRLGLIVLVIDVTEGGEGLEVARRCDEQALVSYWRPLVP